MTNKDFSIQHHLDTSGLNCPEPVMMLHKKVKEMAFDDVLELIATDPSTQRDVPKFCEFLGYKLLKQEHKENLFVYLIQKQE